MKTALSVYVNISPSRNEAPRRMYIRCARTIKPTPAAAIALNTPNLRDWRLLASQRSWRAWPLTPIKSCCRRGKTPFPRTVNGSLMSVPRRELNCFPFWAASECERLRLTWARSYPRLISETMDAGPGRALALTTPLYASPPLSPSLSLALFNLSLSSSSQILFPFCPRRR